MKKTLQTDSGNISYSVSGNGIPLVFLHGFLGNSSIWEPFETYFKQTFQVITIDLPGHGETSIVKDEITMDFSAQLVNNILKKEKVSNIHLIGHSMGGYVGLAYAKLNSKNIKSLTLFNSTAKKDSKQKQADRLKAVRVFDMNPSIFIDEAIKNLFHLPNLTTFSKQVNILTQIAKNNSIIGAQGSLKGMGIREDYVKWLSKQKFPIHYIAGKYDNTISYSSILEQQGKAKLTTLENSGHMGFIEEKEICIKAIEEFVTR